MKYLSAAHTDIGISKKINQDAFGLKIARTPNHNIAFAILCDGMGGLKSGELASALVVNAFSNWFEKELPPLVKDKVDFQEVEKRWREIVQDQGSKILSYGTSNGISLGTTLTAILIVDNQYIYVQVGDSRIYQINTGIQQITKDHTLVQREVESKKITPEQAKVDGRQNVLLQCVGASKVIEPDVKTGMVAAEDVFLLCSDGFRHKITEEEIYGVVAPGLLADEKVMKKSLVDLIDLNKSRNEKDNITAILVKAVR